MRSTTAILLALIGLAAPIEAQAPPAADTMRATLEGTVRGRFDGRTRTLGFAAIEASGAGLALATVADSLGRYSIQGLPPGEVRVRVTHAGHLPLLLTAYLPPGRAVTVDLELRAAPVQLPAIDVIGERERTVPAVDERSADPALTELEFQTLDIGPGVGQPGMLDAVRSLPGNDPRNATDVLFMRGSTTDMKLVLLDGVPVFTPFHVAGLMRSFEPSVLSRADLHVGGAPARYDGGLTHILDLGTRRARRDRPRASGSLDLLAGSLAAELPLGSSAGAIISGRSLHGLGSAPLGGPRPYGYQDVLVTADADLSERQSLRATGFWNAESVRLDFDRTPGDATWSNAAGSFGYRALVGGTQFDVTAGGSGYRAELPLQPTGPPDEAPPPPLRAAAAVDRVRVVAEARWGGPSAPLRAGLSFDHIDAAYEARGGTTSAYSHAVTSTPGAYFDATAGLAPGMTLRAGLRGDLFGGNALRLAPRAALRMDLGPDALLTVAAGRYHQAARTTDYEVERTLAEVANDALDTRGLLPVATADHVVLSLDQQLAGRVSLGLEGFWKRFDGLGASPGETIRSSGVDLRVAGSGQAGVAWLGYGLSWFWSTVDLSGHASDFGGRHLLSAGVAGGLVGALRGEARVAYGAGLPYTSIPFRSSFDDAVAEPAAGPGDQLLGNGTPPIVGGLDEEFLRIDLEVFAELRPNWGGHAWSIRPYVRVLNALDRRDALFYTFQQWRPDSVTPLAERPILPLLGIAFSY